jgi:hypothetical protein
MFWRTGDIDPEPPFRVGPMNGCKARESGLRLNALVRPGATVPGTSCQRVSSTRTGRLAMQEPSRSHPKSLISERLDSASLSGAKRSPKTCSGAKGRGTFFNRARYRRRSNQYCNTRGCIPNIVIASRRVVAVTSASRIANRSGEWRRRRAGTDHECSRELQHRGEPPTP